MHTHLSLAVNIEGKKNPESMPLYIYDKMWVYAHLVIYTNLWTYDHLQKNCECMPIYNNL